MITLNVGGVATYQTMLETIRPLKKLVGLFGDSQQQVFLDRDADVFLKCLNLLRGYPVVRECLQDERALCELAFWQHEMLNGHLPKHYRSVPLTVFTLDQRQADEYGKTHQLIEEVGVKEMLHFGFLLPPPFIKCVVVGAPIDWKDCFWVPNEKIELARLKFKLAKYYCRGGDLQNFSFSISV